MCGGLTTAYSVNKKVQQKYFWRISGNYLSFYKAWGGWNCEGSTEWCNEHCYMRSNPFSKEDMAAISSIKNMIPYSYYADTNRSTFVGLEEAKRYANTLGKLPFDDDIEAAEYITFFGSGCISDYRDIAFIKKIINRYPDKKYRIYTRKPSYYNVYELLGDYGLILSVDKDTDADILNKYLFDEKIKIAIVDHPDNEGIISKVTKCADVVIHCSDCLNQNTCKNMCFDKLEGNVLIIGEYESNGKENDGIHKSAEIEMDVTEK